MQIGVRPEALRLTQTEPMLTGTVAHFENLGSEVFAQIALDQHAVRVTLRATPAERQMLGLGTQVGLRFDPAAALVFGSDGKRLRKVEASAHMISEVA
jgi:multiple sugar transport system ATP-binding protein